MSAAPGYATNLLTGYPVKGNQSPSETCRFPWGFLFAGGMMSVISIKGWKKFQHFKDRKPPWIKLYRDLLDDVEWFELDPMAAKVLVMFWLIASESDGVLPSLKSLSFRLRMEEKHIKQAVTKLSHWLVQDDIAMISAQYQDDAPETEREAEKDVSEYSDDFCLFWKHYPSKTGKGEAWKAWKKVKPKVEPILHALTWQKVSKKWVEGFVPNPATYINQRRWEDEPQQSNQTALPIF